MSRDDGRDAPARPLKIGPAEYGGGGGSSIEQAVTIGGVSDTMQGIAAEYAYLGHLLGEQGVTWKLHHQALTANGDRYYDLLVVDLPDGSRREFYFDITEFFGKMG